MSLNNLSESEESQPSSTLPPTLRLQQTLFACSKAVEAGDLSKSEESISELVDSLNWISDLVVSDPDNEESENTAFQVLSEIHRYVTSPSVDQPVMDALSFELPKAVARFAFASKRCREIVDTVIDRFIAICSPRDMLSILCEALGSPGNTFKAPHYFTPLLSGLSKVLVSIQRRHFEQVKAAVPVILNVLKAVSSEPDDEDTGSEDLFNKAVDIASSIQAVCVKLEGKDNKNLRALFGLFVLQIMAVASISTWDEVSCCLPLVLRLSDFLRYCDLSYLGLITGCDVDLIISSVLGDDGDHEYMSCFSDVKHGAALAVIWGHMFNEVTIAAEADLGAVKDELRSNQAKRWQAVGMLKHIFLCVNLPWQFKKHSINFLLCIMEGKVSHECHDEHIEYSVYMPGLYAALQAVQLVIMYASDAMLRRSAFDALKKVLEDVPSSPRFDILVALIRNSESSSMVAILLDCVRKELHNENCRRISIGDGRVVDAENGAFQDTLFWRAAVLELVELVLRPPMGGPPSLPEYSDAVLSALNLYRFILITESTGKTNFTEVLSKNNLQKAYNEWLLPLRTLLTGIVAENHEDCDQLAFDTACALNPLEVVMYRCIELVEEKLEQST